MNAQKDDSYDELAKKIKAQLNVSENDPLIFLAKAEMQKAIEERKKEKNSLQFFEEPVPETVGYCSDNGCSCDPQKGAILKSGEGFFVLSQSVVDFRMDAKSKREQKFKIDRLNQKGQFIMHTPGTAGIPILVCEKSPLLKNLDKEIASHDAKYWWKTGLLPLRVTPLRNSKEAIKERERLKIKKDESVMDKNYDEKKVEVKEKAKYDTSLCLHVLIILSDSRQKTQEDMLGWVKQLVPEFLERKDNPNGKAAFLHSPQPLTDYNLSSIAVESFGQEIKNEEKYVYRTMQFKYDDGEGVCYVVYEKQKKDRNAIVENISAINAVKNNDITELKKIAETNPEKLSEIDEVKNNPAIIASQRGFADCLRIIANTVPDTLLMSNKNANTSANYAAEGGYTECLNIIAEHAVKTFTNKNKLGLSPAQVAIMKGHVDCFNIIASNAPEALFLTTERGETLAMYAIDIGSTDCFNTISKYAPDTLFDVNYHNESVAHFAVYKNLADCLKIISDIAPTTLLLKNNNGETPLIIAKRLNHNECEVIITGKIKLLRKWWQFWK